MEQKLASTIADIKDQQCRDLVEDIRQKRNTGEPSFAQLSVDDRVLARITDGIYRDPSSALRELISNAYDADATEVTIDLDAPRFSRIVIRDNGLGMTPEILADMIHHIGGSSKRTLKGKALGTVNAEDPERSKSGRPLIGKIGIGLFSVSQLTQHFQIVTKRAGDDFRTVADVVLRTYSEEDLKNQTGAFVFRTGDVAITTEPASEVVSQGTQIVLMDLRNQAKELLRSTDRWEQVLSEPPQAVRPAFHVGKVKDGDPDYYEIEPNVPWKNDDTPAKKFHALYGALAANVGKKANPSVADIFDKYLSVIWNLSLAGPYDYIDADPYSLPVDGSIEFYALSNKQRGQVQQINAAKPVTIGELLNLPPISSDPLGQFSVIIDGVLLCRPLAYPRALLKPSYVGKPIMFIGKADSGFEQYAPHISGGPLRFDGYFYWNSLIVPKENAGILVRIHNAAGKLFDQRFFDYPVAEQTRLRQITAEIFIREGLDPALNIDRESFNFGHPHYQFLTQWVHSALRQIANRLKTLTREHGEAIRSAERTATEETIREWARNVWLKKRGESGDGPPTVAFSDTLDEAVAARKNGVVAFQKERLVANGTRFEECAPQLEALFTVLDAFAVLDELDYDEQEDLLKDVTALYSVAR